jgi:hypothetical protein
MDLDEPLPVRSIRLLEIKPAHLARIPIELEAVFPERLITLIPLNRASYDLPFELRPAMDWNE